MTASGGSRSPVPPPPAPDEWQALEPLLDQMLDCPPHHRAALLSRLSGGDEGRRAALERLVAECERDFPLLDRPAGDRFAAVFGDDSPTVPGLLAGRYEVVREVGRGGMAVVYLARDLKHGREVAVKVVRPELAAALGRSRFLREIEIAARLRHPHIVPLYDSGEQGADPAGEAAGGADASVLYYVMPYEAGHSLRERLAKDGPLPLRDVLGILRDVCDALAHAHRHGIVHRDIKPENVLLSGKHALITDFGVAQAVIEAREETPLAAPGLAVGTPTYMAPEQAAGGAPVDQRADIYAVGVMAYELLAGRPPFERGDRGMSAPAIAPDAAAALAAARPEIPQALADATVRCLAANPADRWQTADELLAVVESIAIAHGGDGSPGARRMALRNAAIVGAAATAAIVIIGLVALVRGRAAERPRALVLGQARQLTSEPGLEVQPSISPDGRSVAYATGNSLRMRIAVRPVVGGRAVNLAPGAPANAWLPRWSPDGTRVLFVSGDGIFSAPASGGAARVEVPARPGAMFTSAAWSPDGREIAYTRADSLLARTVGSPSGRLIATGPDLHSCSWAPDGKRLACVSGNSFHVTVGAAFGVGPMFGNLAPSRIVLVPDAGGPPVSVTDSNSLHQSPAWSRDGRTLYYVSNRQGPSDVYAIDVGEPGPARRDPVRVTTGMGAHSIDFSPDGMRVAYASYSSSANIWSMPIRGPARGATPPAVQLTTGNQTVEGLRVSPDRRWLVYDSDLSGNSDIYRLPIGGGEAERLTHDPLDEFRGVLSPDGKELVYHSFRTGARNLFLMPLDGGPARQLTRDPGQRSMANWSPDGTALAMFDMSASRVLVMRRDARGGWGAPRFTGGSGWRPEWSPDGRTIAFVSPADGRIGIVPADSGAQRDIYVPGAGDPLAELAIFGANGRELYFKSHDAEGRASFWSISADGGRPRLLTRFDDPARTSNRFEFASDGQRFYFTLEDRQSDIWVADVAPR